MSATPRRLALLFLGALAVRWIYALSLFAAMGEPGLLIGDGTGFAPMAADYAQALRAGTISGWGLLGPDISIMPLISWLWTASALAFGTHGVLGFVLAQGAMDAAVCLMVAGIARTVRPALAMPAGIAAALNPTQIVLAGLYYTDTTFLLFATLALYAAARFMREPAWRFALLCGVAIGLAAMTRLLILPYALCLPGLLVLVALLRGMPLKPVVLRLFAAAAVVLVLIAPLVARNVAVYGTLSLTPQSGPHTAFWIAPLVRQTYDGTPWEKAAQDMRAREEATAPARENPFEQSQRLAAVGRAALAEMGVAAIAKTWAYGIALNLGTPALAQSPPVIGLPRTGFYATPGATMPEKIFNFLFRSDNPAYALALGAGIAGLALMRLLQLVGLGLLLPRRESWPALALLGSWTLYVLLVNGPIASPKYRLPIEPALMVLSGAAIAAICERRRRKPQSEA